MNKIDELVDKTGDVSKTYTIQEVMEACYTVADAMSRLIREETGAVQLFPMNSIPMGLRGLAYSIDKDGTEDSTGLTWICGDKIGHLGGSPRLDQAVRETLWDLVNGQRLIMKQMETE